MHVVILAAGKGSRLGTAVPKPLTILANGMTILAQQLSHLEQVVSLDNVLLVVGYKKDLIMDAFPNLLYVYNPQFAEENTARSLLRALGKIDDDLLWLNGDVVFRSGLLSGLIRAGKTSMMVNRTVVGEEEVKYSLDDRGQIKQVSKSVDVPEGEALGINFFRQQDLGLLRKGLEACGAGDYFERGIEWALQQDMELWPYEVPVDACVEVDFPEDLVMANALLTKWHGSLR